MTQIKKLSPGDIIGIITPSRHITGDEKSIQKSIALLRDFGFKIKLGKCFKKRTYSSAGTRFQRAEEINSMFADKKVSAIFCSLGGDAANQVLDLLDYGLIKKNPKPLVGYSDITHLLIAICNKTDMTTFHGPNLSVLARLDKTSLQQMTTLLMKQKRENIFPKCQVIKHGRAEDTLMGGNLFVLNALNKTEFAPDYKDTILFWEDIDEGLSAIEYQLYQLNISGVLKKISGMVIGHIHGTKTKENQSFKKTLLELTKGYNYPIIKTECFGHFVKEFYTFPVGDRAIIDTQKKIFSF